MPLQPGDIMFVGWDADNDDISFVTTVDIAGGDIIYFTDDEWDGSAFFGSEQLFEWTVPTGGVEAGTLVEIDMTQGPADASFDVGGSVDYIRGGGLLARGNEMFWAFQGTRVGNTVTPDNFVGVIANEATGNDMQTPNLSGTGLTVDNGAIIIDGDEDYMEFAADGTLPDPVTRDDLIAAISDLDNWDTADGGGNSNPNGTGFDLTIPDVVCFTRGTLLRTPEGARAIETLQVGDVILTVDHGAQPLRWIGTRDVVASTLAHRLELCPVLVRRGAIAENVPDRDMWLSPQHKVVFRGAQAELLFGEAEVLIPVVALVNDRTILVDRSQTSVTYYHLLFDQHELIWANGLIAESFFPARYALEALNPTARKEVLRLFPDFCDTSGKTARIVLKPREARLLAAGSP